MEEDESNEFYLQFAEFNTGSELVEMKNNEIEELTNYCQKCYEEQKSAFEKRKNIKMKKMEQSMTE